jgi:hypothetical protein
MGNLLLENFAGTNGTDLSARPDDIGNSWVPLASSTGPILLTGTGRGYSAAGGFGRYKSSVTPPTPDYGLLLRVYTASVIGTGQVVVFFRCAEDVSSYGYLSYSQFSGQWSVVDSGGATATLNKAYTAGQPGVGLVIVSGNKATLYADGTKVGTITVTPAAAGLVVVQTNTANAPTTGLQIESVTAFTKIPVTDPHWDCSNLAWDNTGAALLNNTPGNPLGLTLDAAASDAALEIDVSAIDGAGYPALSYPVVRSVVDGGPAADTTLVSGQTLLRLGGGTAYDLTMRGVDSLGTEDRWTPVLALRVTGLWAPGGTVARSVGPIALVHGDSKVEGKGTNEPFTNGVQNQDSERAWPKSCALALGLRPVQRGFGGRCWAYAGGAYNVPPFFIPGNSAGSSCDKQHAGKSLLDGNGRYVTQPAIIFNEHGKNDASFGRSDSEVTASVTPWFAAERLKAPAVPIFGIIPFDGSKRSAILAGFAAYVGTYTTVAGPGGATIYVGTNDPLAHLIDLGAGAAVGLAGTPSVNSPDGTHMNGRWSLDLGAWVAACVQAVLQSFGAADRALLQAVHGVAPDNKPAVNADGEMTTANPATIYNVTVG